MVAIQTHVKIPKRISKLNIAIVIVLENSTSIDEYEHAIESVKCYAEFHKYHLEIVRDDDEWTQKCPQKDVSLSGKIPH